jgi:3-oxoacyl-[acyl-carrier-protein] synthase II
MNFGLAVRGLGAVSSAGGGTLTLAALVASGRSALRAYPTSLLSNYTPWLGAAPGWSLDAMQEKPCPLPQQHALEWGVAAASEALEASGARGRIPTKRIGLALGVNLIDHPRTLHAFTGELAEGARIGGPRLGIAGACASSGLAFIWARTLLESQDVDAMVVGGTDVITPRVIAGFRQLGILAEGPCGPFSKRLGTSLGQGAAFLVLERARLDDATVRHWLRGEGASADAHHPTQPDPSGRGISTAMLAALDAAGLPGGELEYVNAHATGTAANDAAEMRALRRTLGERADEIPVSGTKSITGHCLAAASSMEIVTTLAAAEQGLLPPTLHCEEKRPLAPADPVPEPRMGRWGSFASTSAGFGGYNSVTVFSESPPKPAESVRQPGVTIHIERFSSMGHANAPELDLRRAVRGVDLRRARPLARNLCAAVSAVLPSRSPRSRDATGLVVSLGRPSGSVISELSESIAAHGIEQVNASSFVDSLPSASAGWVSAALQTRGPLFTVFGGCAGPLLAIILSADRLLRQPDLERVVVCHGDEARATDPSKSSRDGAIAVSLAREGAWALRGWSVGAPGASGPTLESALDRARIPREALASLIELQSSGCPISWEASLPELERKLGALSPGRHLAIIASDEQAGSCALVFQTSPAPA